MIHEEICTYEVAKLAKEKGFNEKCNFYYQKGVISTDGCFNRYNKGVDSVCSAPTQSRLQRWLREEKMVYIEVYIDWYDSIYYNLLRYSWRINTPYTVGTKNIGGRIRNESELYFDSYELALEDALKYALENLL